MKRKDLWEPTIYIDNNFSKNLLKIESFNIKIKEILWLYYYLINNKDEEYEKEIKDYLMKMEIEKEQEEPEESEESEENEEEENKEKEKKLKKEEKENLSGKELKLKNNLNKSLFSFEIYNKKIQNEIEFEKYFKNFK